MNKTQNVWDDPWVFGQNKGVFQKKWFKAQAVGETESFHEQTQCGTLTNKNKPPGQSGVSK